MCNTNCVSKLNFRFVSKTSCYDVFRNVTCCVCSRTVNFCWIFTRECTAAVTSVSAVRINDDFTSSKTSIPLRSADYETASWVNEVFCFCID